MTATSDRSIFVGLVHYPVVNRRGEPVISAITNLDLHDISRTCRTYDISAFFVINPAPSQKELLNDIVQHWTNGAGARTNRARREAFSLVRHGRFIEDVKGDIARMTGSAPEVWTTSARKGPGRLGWGDAAMRLQEPWGPPILLLFGTGGGLAREVFSNSDFILEPIEGKRDYNHLSVRSAVAITLDRLFARRT